MSITRVVATILATVAFVAFALSNAQHVEVSFVIGEPVESRLIFVLAISFGLGALSSFFFQMVQDANKRLLHRKMRLQLKSTQGAHKELERE